MLTGSGVVPESKPGERVMGAGSAAATNIMPEARRP